MIDRQFLIDLKLVSKDETTEDSLINLHKALGVADLSALQKVDLFAVLRSPSVKELDTKRLVNANAWIALALAKAKEESGSDFDAKKLESAIVEIRSMTSERPEVFLPRMKQALSDAGIRLVILPYLKNSELTGVVKWFSDINQVMLALNCKGKYADIFWFTLFHELGHVRQQDRRRVIVSGSSDAAEVNADEFAKNTLIPIREYELFLASGAYQTEAGVINFAKTVGVHPGIVVGRLHKENRIPQANLNGLRVQFIVLTQ
jgi:Zn-dependent peptidase ImmA (M78 family)